MFSCEPQKETEAWQLGEGMCFVTGAANWASSAAQQDSSTTTPLLKGSGCPCSLQPALFPRSEPFGSSGTTAGQAQ